MRENPLDLGWFVLSFRTTQMEAALAACERIGARAVNAPRSYEAGAQPMREAMIELDAGLRCALVEVGGAKNDLPLFAEPVAAACAIVPALPKALAFYRDALGLSVAVTLDHPGEPFAGMIGAPSATRVQKALLTAGTWTGKLELLQLGLPAGYEQRDATIHTDGRRLGYWMMSVMTANLDLLQAACRYAGIPILRGPATIDRPCYGRVKAMIVRGPGGELLECLAPANRITRP
jgi:catechol 2,3-dioxygenase-like lactoylglutathione lyase family enzyme